MNVRLLVHVDESLGPIDRARAERHLKLAEGVAEAEFNRDHLMMVQYDPVSTRAAEIVGGLRRLGYHAQAVGL